MSVILKGSPDFRKKHDAAGVVANIMFGFLPIIMLVAAVVFLIIQLLRLDDNIFVKIFQLIGSFLEVRVGYFLRMNQHFRLFIDKMLWNIQYVYLLLHLLY